MDKIERLRALEKAVELVAKATPGPWQAKNEYEWDEIIGNVDGPDAGQFHYSHVCSVDMNDERKPEHFANAELIIAAVNFIREHGSALIAELGQEVGAVAMDDYCAACKGSGEVIGLVHMHDPQDSYEATVTCPECDGTGVKG